MRHAISCLVSPFLLIIVAAGTGTASPGPADARPAGLSAVEWAQIRTQIEHDRYSITWTTETPLAGLPGAWLAVNRAQDLQIFFADSGIHVAPTNGTAPSWTLGLTLSGYGWDGRVDPLSGTAAIADGNRVEYRRGPLTEWYVNDERGLEHGFTIAELPDGGATTSTLVLELAVSGNLVPELADDEGAVLRRPGGMSILRYAGLEAWDADGRDLSCTLGVIEGGLVITVDTDTAAFPVTVDPLLTQVAKLLPTPDPVKQVSPLQFGYSVAVDGDTLVAGANWENNGGLTRAGAAYVFTRSGTAWSLQQRLVAADPADDDEFGSSVAISSDTAVVGAPNDDHSSLNNPGSAYVFVRSAGVWSQQQKLTAADADNGDVFGFAVAVAGDTVVVGAKNDDEGALSNSGAAYAFVRSSGVWSQQQKLVTSDATHNDHLGSAVALEGDTAVVGADQEYSGNPGAAYVFLRSGLTWTQQQKLTASDGEAGDRLGASIALWGETAVVGAPDDDLGGLAGTGSAYVFVRSGVTWTQEQKLTGTDQWTDDNFGCAVAVSGDTAVVGVHSDDLPGLPSGIFNGGSAYVFTRSGTTWSLEQMLTASDAADNDNFGWAVAMSGDTVVSAAPFDDHDGGVNAGSAYVFTRSGTVWSEQQQMVALDGSVGDGFGWSVAVDETTAVVGAPFDDHGGFTDAGAAYVFVASGTTWSLQQKLAAQYPFDSDNFGYTVAVSGNTALVGVPSDSYGALTNAGSAYVFVRSGNAWTQQTLLTASDAANSDRFGYSVALDGDTAVVGAAGKADLGGTPDVGAAYVFVRSGSSWSEEQKLMASDPALRDVFGGSVAVWEDTAVVGAPLDDDDGANSGSAYVFVRSAGVWTEEQKLTASDAAAGDQFSRTVALSAETALIGAYLDDDNGADSGSAYVFVHSGGVWTEQQKLTPGDGASDDWFGISVAISGDTAMIGAHGDDNAGGTDAGAAYTFTRAGSTWSQEQKLEAADGDDSDLFGYSVAVSGDIAVSGAPNDDHTWVTDAGSAYVFEGPKADLAITKDDGQDTAVPGQPAIYTITVTNAAGPDIATGAMVTDTFPPQLVGCTWSCVASGGAVCNPGPVSGPISDVVSLPVGGAATYTATCTVAPGATGVLANTATVTPPAGTRDTDPANNSTTDIDTLTPQVDLAITKDDGQALAVPGETVTYAIVASNIVGPSDVSGATVSDTFPPELTGCSWSCVAAGGASCWPGPELGDIFDSAYLPVGGTATYTATCTLDPGASGTLFNTATLTAPAGVTDLVPANNTDTDTDTITPEADLAMTKDDGQTEAVPGEPITYTIVAANASGPSDVTGATVSDTLPSELTACSWTCVSAGGGTCSPGPVAGDISDSVDLPVGGTATYTATCTLDSGASGSLVNTATITAPAGVTDPAAANNSATDTDTVTPEVDLAITKDDGLTEAVPGEPVTYTIVAFNASGPSDVTGATVSDTFPAELTACSWTCVGAGGGTCNPGPVAGDISDTVGLPVGSTATYTATCTLDSGASGSLVNTATITAPAGVTDPAAGNNSATDTDTVTPEADLAITKDDGLTEAVPGEPLTYTIVASNASGPSDVSGPTVSDTFPAELTGCSWTCVGAGGGTCIHGPVTGDINDSAYLPVGGSATYTATCTLDPGASGSLVNTATITAPAGVADPTPGNNSATDTDTILGIDFGDAPDPTFPTLLGNDGARHVITGGLYLGAGVDGEADGQPTAAADGDDSDGSDDEDGVALTSAPVAGNQGSVIVSASAAGVLNAWIDMDRDGDWDDPGEQVFTDRVLTPGVNNLSITVPADASEGSTFARFRVASAGGLSVTGLAADGEVEDHAVSIERECDLEVLKTDWVDPAVAGLGLRYTLTVTNLGPSDASGLTLIDTLPAAVSFLNAIPGSPACEESGGVVTCVIGDVAAGAATDVTITVLVDPAASGTITNSADGSADETDPAPGNNTAIESTTVVVPLFADAFESGDTSAWTATVPGFALRKLALADPRDGYWTSFRVDEELLASLGPAPVVLLAGVAGNGVFVFVVEAASEPACVAVRARARLDDGSWVETEWTAFEAGRGWLEVEWRRSMPGLVDGRFEVRSTGLAVLTLNALDNTESALHAVAVAEKDGRAAVVDLSAPVVSR